MAGIMNEASRGSNRGVGECEIEALNLDKASVTATQFHPRHFRQANFLFAPPTRSPLC